jgi:tetratricopeptide (TPR) repeat protein
MIMLNKKPFFLLALLSLMLAACQTVSPTAAPAESEPKASQATAPTEPAPAEATTENPEPSRSQQAMESVKAGDIDKAIEQFKQILASDPTTPHAYTNLGLLYLHGQKPALAKQAFERAIIIDNKDAVALNNLAIIQRQNGEFKKALFNYYKAVNAKPDYANAHLNLGILLDLYLQDLPKALEQYESYQKLTGGSDEKVSKWIVDIKRRIADSGGK